MKRWLFFAFLTLVMGLTLGSLAGKDPGYVLLSWNRYSLETSVWFFLLMLGLAVVLLYLLFRVSLLALGSDWRFNEWLRTRRATTGRRQTMKGLLMLAQGRWSRAERLLTRSAVTTDMPLVNYLAAAKAADEQGRFETADELLNEASKTTRGAELAVGISHAQLLISRGQKEQALAVVVSLRDKYPRHSYLLKLLVRLYQDLEDWVALHELLPALGRLSRLPEEQLRELEQKVYIQLMNRLVKTHKDDDCVPALKKQFHNIPRQKRYTAGVLGAFAAHLHAAGKDDMAEAELRNGLKYVWDDALLTLYGELEGADANRQMLFAEQQLKERPNDPVLLLVLARLARRQNLPERVREFLTMGLELKPMPALQVEMGRLLVAEEQYQEACRYFQLASGGEEIDVPQSSTRDLPAA